MTLRNSQHLGVDNIVQMNLSFKYSFLLVGDLLKLLPGNWGEACRNQGFIEQCVSTVVSPLPFSVASQMP